MPQQGQVTITTQTGQEPEGHAQAMLGRYEAGQQAASQGLSHVPDPATPQEAQAPTASQQAPATPQQAPTAPAEGQAEPRSDFVDTLVASAGLNRDALTQEYLAGGLSDASYKALAAKGVNREAVDQYLAGLEAQSQQANQAYEQGVIQATVGTQEKYQEMTAWATQHLSAEDKASFNEAVSSGNKALAEFAVKGLFARFSQANPAEPTLVNQGTPTGGTLAFSSWEQVRTEMAKPEYKKDPAFREHVRQRLAVSGDLP